MQQNREMTMHFLFHKITHPNTNNDNDHINQSNAIGLPSSGFFEDLTIEGNIDLHEDDQEECDESEEEWEEDEWERIEMGDLSDADDQEDRPTNEIPCQR